MDQKIRVMLVDDHALLRDALKLLIDGQADMKVAGEAGDAETALREAPAAKADIILLDITMPGRSGISVLPALHKLCPSTACVVALSEHIDPAYLRAALAAGAAGYVVKSSSSAVLFEAIRRVHAGETYIDPSVRGHVAKLEEPLAAASEPVPSERLSEREHQVLVFLAHGLPYQEIAEKMGISVKTVETYRTRLRVKLNFKNRADLIRFAIESGILEKTVDSR